MNKREAKMQACRFAFALLNADQPNNFLYEGTDADDARLQAAWKELMDELYRRGVQGKVRSQ